MLYLPPSAGSFPRIRWRCPSPDLSLLGRSYLPGRLEHSLFAGRLGVSAPSPSRIVEPISRSYLIHGLWIKNVEDTWQPIAQSSPNCQESIRSMYFYLFQRLVINPTRTFSSKKLTFFPESTSSPNPRNATIDNFVNRMGTRHTNA